MKALYLAIVVALSLAIGLWWTDDPAPAKSTVKAQTTQPRYSVPGVPGLRPALVKTLEPTTDDPEVRAFQDVLWSDLRSFAKDVELTDAQWEQFQLDLSELASIESAAFSQGIHLGFDGIVELSHALEADLLERCAAHMTKSQMAELRFRFYGLVARVRRTHYVPTVIPES